jgi:hypothetical protein
MENIYNSNPYTNGCVKQIELKPRTKKPVYNVKKKPNKIKIMEFTPQTIGF